MASTRTARATFAACLIVLIAMPASAGIQHRVDPSTFDPLSAPLASGARVRLHRIPLTDERPSTLVVERFDVLAPGAVIEVFDSEGRATAVTPQPMRQFRGAVEGDPGSLVYFSIARGSVDGIIVTRDRKFTMRSEAARATGKPAPGAVTRDVYIEETSAAEEYAIGTGFECGVEGRPITPSIPSGPRRQSDEVGADAAYAWPTTTATTMLNIAIDSDSALYARFSNNAASVETFLRNLAGAAATIYKRDLRADIRVPYLGVRTATDPWAVNPGQAGTWDGQAVESMQTLHALLEYGDYWRTSPPTTAAKSAAVLVSGQTYTGGVAWTDILCGSTQQIDPAWGYGSPYDNHTVGPFAYCGGVGLNPADRTVPNPQALTNYGAPSNYWPLMEFVHELGHVVESIHTHCIGLSDADKLTYGRNFVDICYSGEGENCYSGSESLPSDGLDSKGTIMSYCHMLAGADGVRFIFGRTGEASHQVVDNMKARLEEKTPTGFSAITAPGTVAPGASGAASVTNTPGLTYDWTITNGTFSGGGTTATGASVNFTATTNPVTLRVTATNSSGCSVSDTKSVFVGTALNPPQQMSAHATTSTNVYMSWNPEQGVPGYNVYRKTATSDWTLLASPTNNFYNDGTVNPDSAYLYKVRTRDAGGGESADSSVDLATTIIFTDNLGAGSTPVKAVHFNELRTAANALRALRGLAARTWTDTIASGVRIKAVHMTEIREEINSCRAALGFDQYNPTIAEPGTYIRQVQVYAMREAVK